MVQKRNALGKGLGALLKDAADNRSEISGAAKAYVAGTTQMLPISVIKANPFQPRQDFDQERLLELAESIKVQGLIQPITVRVQDQDQFQIISGERRFRAAQLAGLKEIPAFIRTANDQQMLEMALIENIQREDLNALEVALSYHRLIEECALSQDELGGRVGKDRSTVTNYLRLLKLPPGIQAGVRDGLLSMGHARALLGLSEPDAQLYLYNLIVQKQLSVRETEKRVRDIQQGGSVSETEKAKGLSPEFKKIQSQLSDKMGTKVAVSVKPNGQGEIKIPFYSNEDLERILELLDW